VSTQTPEHILLGAGQDDAEREVLAIGDGSFLAARGIAEEDIGGDAALLAAELAEEPLTDDCLADGLLAD
jgi:hypothetical protein